MNVRNARRLKHHVLVLLLLALGAASCSAPTQSLRAVEPATRSNESPSEVAQEPHLDIEDTTMEGTGACDRIADGDIVAATGMSIENKQSTAELSQSLGLEPEPGGENECRYLLASGELTTSFECPSSLRPSVDQMTEPMSQDGVNLQLYGDILPGAVAQVIPDAGFVAYSPYGEDCVATVSSSSLSGESTIRSLVAAVSEAAE